MEVAPDITYVFELKVNGTAQQVLDQINRKGYLLPYETEGCDVVKVGVRDGDSLVRIESLAEGSYCFFPWQKDKMFSSVSDLIILRGCYNAEKHEYRFRKGWV